MTESQPEILRTAGPFPTEPRAQVHTPEPAPEPTAQGDAAPTAPAPAPRPRPGPRGPRPAPPARQAAAAPATSAVTPAVTPAAPLDDAVVEAAAAYGRVDSDGTVHVTDGDTERVVGQFPDVPATEAMSLYIRRYVDLKAQVDLFRNRLPQLSGKDLDGGVATLAEALAEPAAVGDLAGLRTELAELTAQATSRKQQLAAERAAAREQALGERTALVEEAERLAALDPARVQWRSQGDAVRNLLDTWKASQRSGVRLDKKEEDALWKRFAKARSTFDRNRRQHFSALDNQHAEAKRAKEALIERAEALSGSTDWAGTSAAYRDLMQEWKGAGRAARKVDDALWARFRAVQDAFFAARSEQHAATDAEYQANLDVKNEILVDAEALLPVRDIAAAKAALRTLQERWDAAGKVPREEMSRTEARMRAVESAVRSAEDSQWKRSNPQKLERAEGAAAQLQAAIDALEVELDDAKAGGDATKIKAAQEALDARRAWLTQVLRAADDAR